MAKPRNPPREADPITFSAEPPISRGPSRVARALRRIVVALVGVGLAAAVMAGAWRRYRSLAGDPRARLGDRWHEGRRVLDRRGRELRELPSEAGHRGRALALEAMGDRIITATVVSEDRDFFDHEGVATGAIVRAALQNVRHRRLVSGASTITQQLVKILDHAGEPRKRSIGEKLKEAARAENLERAVGKRVILAAYLNRLSYGHGLTGPESAALAYFGKRAQDLSWAEASYLAVMPRAPSYLDPIAHPERILPRQKKLLDAIRDEGYLSPEEHARAIAEPVAVRRVLRPFLAPHFVEALIAEGGLEPGPLTRSTIDLDLQRDVEALVASHLVAIAAEGASNAAILVVDNATGEILAYAGSADFDDPSIAGQLDVLRARRQPGSTIKPFVYALAFARGHDGAEVLADVPTRYDDAWEPGNLDGGFEGPVSARDALASSLNVPAIRLAAELPQGVLLDTLRALGLASLDEDPSYYGLSLALGTGEVTPRELAIAYVALARGGDRIPLRMVMRSAGPVAEGERVIDEGVAALVTEILADSPARARVMGGRDPYALGFPVAVKTGTSSGFRDAWAAGWTRERTVVVWVGNADGAPTAGLTGASGAGPLFAAVMRRAMRDVTAPAPLWDEALLDAADVCPLSGKRAGPACSAHVTRPFLKGHAPEELCDMHVHAAPVVPRLGEAPFRCDPAGGGSIVILPDIFDAWLAERAPGAPGRDPFGVPWYPATQVFGCSPEGVSELRVDAPAPGTVIAWREGEPVLVELRASALGGDGAASLAAVEFVVDGRLVARSASPFRAGFAAEPGDHEVVVRPIDPRAPVRVATSRFSVR